MEVLAHLINVEYKLEEEYSTNKGYLLKIKKIVVLPNEYIDDEVSLDIEKGIIMNTHQTANNMGLYQLAIEIKDGEDYICKCRVNSQYVSEMRYDKENNLFFDSNIYDKNYKGRFELIKERSNPFDTAGSYNIDIFNGDILIKIINVRINPSSITYEDYLKMIDDLRNIRESLVVNLKSKIGVFKKWNVRIEHIENQINEVEKHLKYIEKKPKSALKKNNKLVDANNIKKVTSKIIRERIQQPNKTKINIDNVINSLDTYEHKAIYKSLLQIENKLLSYKIKYKDFINRKYLEIRSLSDNYKNKTNKDLYDIYNKLKTERNKIFDLTDKIQSTNSCIFKKQSNLIEADIPVNIMCTDNTFNKAELTLNEVSNCFEFKGEASYIKLNNTFSLSLSPNLNNLNEFNYRDLLIENNSEIIKSEIKKDKLRSKRFSFTLNTQNINEIMFMVKELSNTSLGQVIIKGIVKKDIYSPNIFGGIHNINWWTFDIDFIKVISINNKVVPVYSQKEIEGFLESYTTKIRNKDSANCVNINIENTSDEFYLLKSIVDKEINISDEQRNILEGKTSINILEEKLRKIKSLSIFNECTGKCKVNLKPTQVFINDYHYRKVYKELKNIDDNIMYSFEKSNEVILMNSTQNIYEIWCLFTLVDVLINDMGWELLNNQSVKDVLNSIIKSNRKQINDFKIKLVYIVGNKPRMYMNILYENKVYYNKNRFKIPDFKLELSLGDNTYIVYLDAKYRNYEKQGKRVFIENDIKGVALKKYFAQFIFTENQPIVSMIVHSYNSDKYVEFAATPKKKVKLVNGNESLIIGAHTYGGFPLVPSNKAYLKLFFKMLFEYHFSQYDICWNCGEVNEVEKVKKKTKGNFDKFYYTCRSCDEFWVKTHCYESSCNKDLVKHLINYHNTFQNNPWNVVCPCCDSRL